MNRNRVTKRDIAWFVAAVALLLFIVAWAGEAQAQTMPPACPIDANGIVLCHAVWLLLVQSDVIVTGLFDHKRYRTEGEAEGRKRK